MVPVMWGHWLLGVTSTGRCVTPALHPHHGAHWRSEQGLTTGCIHVCVLQPRRGAGSRRRLASFSLTAVGGGPAPGVPGPNCRRMKYVQWGASRREAGPVAVLCLWGPRTQWHRQALWIEAWAPLNGLLLDSGCGLESLVLSSSRALVEPTSRRWHGRGWQAGVQVCVLCVVWSGQHRGWLQLVSCWLFGAGWGRGGCGRCPAMLAICVNTPVGCRCASCEGHGDTGGRWPVPVSNRTCRRLAIPSLGIGCGYPVWHVVEAASGGTGAGQFVGGSRQRLHWVGAGCQASQLARPKQRQHVHVLRGGLWLA
jgi:hypothetical protein